MNNKRHPRSSLFLYIGYRYFSAFMLVGMAIATTVDWMQDAGPIDDVSGLLILMTVFLLLQIMASRFIFGATGNKNAIAFNNGHIIRWHNVKFLNRVHLFMF